MLPNITRSFLATAFTSLVISTTPAVECDQEQTLTKALEIARPGTTIHVEGTCYGLFTITTDSLTLDGGGTAIIDGGGGGPEYTSAITIDGARDITITGFIVQHSPGAGIWGQRASTFTVRDTTLQDNVATGIGITGNSAADIADCSVSGGTSGIVAGGSSNVILSGAISAKSTGFYGVAAFDKSSLEFRGVALTSSDHGLFGMLSLDSTFIVPGLIGQEQTVIEADNNGMDGIRLGDHATLRSMTAAKISASDNGSSGIWVGNQSTIGTPPVPVEYFFENNPVGMYFSVGSGAAINGGELTVSGNDIGLLGEGADLTIDNANITSNNTSDVKLSLGTRAVFNGVSYGSIDCDDTVVSRGACY